MKPRYKRRIIWTSVITIATLALAVVIVPPMITLNSSKPQLQTAIMNATGMDVDIRGNVHFSLLGGATIIAHDIQTPYGNISSAMFTVPLTSALNISDAKLTGDITIYDANISLSSLGVTSFGVPIEIYNSTVSFHGKDYEIIRLNVDGSDANGTVRTSQHKYDIQTHNDQFRITNKTNNLEIIGQLDDNGAAHGTIEIDTDNLNKFFEFEQPKIPGQIAVSSDFAWDGNTGFDFTNIHGDNFAGNIELRPNGTTVIQISSPDINYDFSSLINPSKIFTNTDLNLDLYGELKFGPRIFNHLKIIAGATPGQFKINTIIADDITIAGGYIDENGAHNIMINMPYDNKPAMCIFSGTPDNWRCSAFAHNNLTGSLSVTNNKFDIIIQSQNSIDDINTLIGKLSRFGTSGTIHFAFANMAGTADVTPRGNKITYTFAKNKTLADMGYNMEFIPYFMQTAHGDFTTQDGNTIFTPTTGNWNIALRQNAFVITGDNFKKWLPNIDLQSVMDLPYTISGKYSDRTISDLLIQIGGMEFSGRMSGDTLTLHTDVLNINSFANDEFINRFSELEFLTTHPIVLPFGIPIKISLDANKMIYNGIPFANFVYSLKDDVQTFSITDSDRGNMLATISQDKSNYDIFVQLNRFVTNGKFLTDDVALNIRDAMLTGDVAMHTHGHTAHDLIYNLVGDVDMTFNGGYVIGLGLDNFFARADEISSFNAEYALSDALGGGETRLKKLHITGKYENGNFITSGPFTLSMPHTDAIGELDISNGKMMVILDMTLRGTSPEPQPINMRISSDGVRDYSLSDIMNNFDAGFMRAFINTHDAF